MQLQECEWGPQAKSVRPATSWQLRLADFVTALETRSPYKSPQFDWRQYASMPWMGQPALRGMELGEPSQLPEYASAVSSDWRNKLRFLSCFLYLGGHVMKLWVRAQLLSSRPDYHFYYLISNSHTLNLFAQLVTDALMSRPIPNQALMELVTYHTNPAVDPHIAYPEAPVHRADQRLYQAQLLDDRTHFDRALARYMILSWTLDLLPIYLTTPKKHYYAVNLPFKPSWRPLGRSVWEAGQKTYAGWFGVDGIPMDTTWRHLYRDCVDPLLCVNNGKSSQVCSLAHQCYLNTIEEWASLYGKEKREMEDIVCLQSSCRVMNLVAQLLARKLTKDYNQPLVNEVHDLTGTLSLWIQTKL